MPHSVDDSELAILRALVEGTAQATGEDFFKQLVQNLALATGVPNAFVAEFAEDQQSVRTLAFWMHGGIIGNQAWALPGTPCEIVLRGQLCHYPADVWQLFPNEPADVESYLGVPLIDQNGTVLGHLAVFDDKIMPEQPKLLYTFKIFAARAAAELSRIRATQQLRQSERQFRDLFDEAPIAYVLEDFQSRFISANRAALRILGVTPELVPGFLGASLIADNPEAQNRGRTALAAIQSGGTGPDSLDLELRRHDNGKPIWVQWWTRPDPSGKYTRTMFFDITEQVLLAQEQSRLQAQNRYLQEEIKSGHNFDEIIGRSPAIVSLLKQVQRVAVTDTSVLIQGESGTGKELIARAIHSASKRRDQPLIKVNCAALPANLIESELFGHEKGAFTGAIAKRTGRFELAHGGTLFLDEIGEIPLDVQVKLLRVLQEREFERVGGQQPIKVDVRVIAATNRTLLDEVAAKNFREDLFYRLNVFPLTTPPLRERLHDIPYLVQFLMDKFAPKLGKKFTHISAAALQRLMAYAWPGNIRELENVIERAIILADGEVLDIEAEQLPTAALTDTAAAELSLEQLTREHIAKVLEDCEWVIEGTKGAAQKLQVRPSTLRYRMKKLGLSR